MSGLFLALAVLAAPAAAPCGATPSYPADLRDWPRGRPLAGALAIGRATDLRPMATATVRLAVQPSRPLSGTHLASASFEVRRAGVYRVAAGGTTAAIRPLWLDVAGADNRPLAAVAHGHGPACSTVTKVVEFRLARGRHVVLATGLTSAAPVRVLIVPKR